MNGYDSEHILKLISNKSMLSTNIKIMKMLQKKLQKSRKWELMLPYKLQKKNHLN